MPGAFIFPSEISALLQIASKKGGLIMSVASIIGIVNQKGGTGKTTSCVNLGVDLAHEGKRVLLVDCDPQGSMTISLGYPQPDTLSVSLADLMGNVLNNEPVILKDAVLHHAEGVDLLCGSRKAETVHQLHNHSDWCASGRDRRHVGWTWPHGDQRYGGSDPQAAQNEISKERCSDEAFVFPSPIGGATLASPFHF